MHRSPPCFATSLVLALALISPACAEDPEPELPVAVDAVYDMTVDFAQYRSYALVEYDEADRPRPPGYTEANRIAVHQAVLGELSDRGLVLNPAAPDLLISPFVRLTPVAVVSELWWWDRYWGWYWGYGVPWYHRDVVNFEAGTLIIDIIDVGDPDDPDDDALVFRGVATALIPTDPVDRSERITEAIAEIFAYWPTEEPS